jgi:peptidoglycan/LPS O-acetylase OafA/YrhL
MLVTQPKENNFDLLRLIAAFQIASYHCYEHLHFTSSFLNSFIYTFRYFFGIHILFTISGFLIFSSYNRNPNLKAYFRNRFLRVYPGLWLCLLITIGILTFFGYINHTNIFSRQFWLWLGTQVSFLQFYTPDMFRHFGVRNPNGALWTIPVEISFYIFIPFLFWLFRKIKINRNAWIIIWMAISIAYNIFYQPYKFSAERSDFVKIMGVTIGPYLFYFLLGAIAANNWQKIRKCYEGKGLLWLGVYLLYCFIFCSWLHKFQIGYWTNVYHFISVVLLSQGVISLAYTAKWLNGRILRNNDFSFGVYIYHMPVINVLLELGYGYKNYSFIIVLVSISVLAYLSWKFVERPALSLKSRSVK